jgi:hypothetical protein
MGETLDVRGLIHGHPGEWQHIGSELFGGAVEAGTLGGKAKRGPGFVGKVTGNVEAAALTRLHLAK